LLPVVSASAEEDSKHGSSYSTGVILGMIIGGSLPLVLMQIVHNGDNGPESAIPELTSKNFWRYVGKKTPFVILLHSGTNNDCQEFRWMFETVFESFQKDKKKSILFGTVDEDTEHKIFGDFSSQHSKGQPTLLWFGPNAKNPILYSSSVLEAKTSWIISWVERRFQQGSQGAQLQAVQELIGRIYHWYDGYDTTETEQLSIDEKVENKSMMTRMFSGHDASVYGEVLPEGIETWLDHINKFQGDKLTKDDVLYDLGCGTGKVVVQMSLTTPCHKVAGIELSETRYRHGINALKKAQALVAQAELESLASGQPERVLPSLKQVTEASAKLRLQLYKGDISKPVYMDGTHVFAASTTWPGILLTTIVKNLCSPNSACKTFATLRPLSEIEFEPFRGVMHKWKTISVAVSWQDNAALHLYQFKRT